MRGPWENCPHNPIVRTVSQDEPWWSRGHATPVEGPAGDWWFAYHGYENGLRTLGRQMLLEPFDWSADGWPRARGGDLSKPLAKPRNGQAGPHGIAFSDSFANDRLGTAYALFKPNEGYASRIRHDDNGLTLAAEGTLPGNSSPLVINAGDPSYSLSVDVELVGGAQGGILLFYDPRYHCGLGSDGKRLRFFKVGAEVPYGVPVVGSSTRLSLRLLNRENVVTFFHSTNGRDWQTYASLEVSGYNHNIADGFLSLRPALYAAGKGSVIFRNLKYAASS